MCTVSYIPNAINSNFVLTSNRDEDLNRPTLAPMIYNFEKVQLAFPKDERSGGSWIAMNNKGKINCLLNGGIGFHKKQKYHTISRGTILIELTKSPLTTREFFGGIDLHNVEPFTVVSIQLENSKVQELLEVIWDGSTKYFRNLDKDEPHIWSSPQLYSKYQKELRQIWFADFMRSNQTDLTLEKINEFHSGNHSEDIAINVVIERGDVLKTVSITQITSQNGKFRMSYSDLLRQSRVEVELY